MIWKLTVVLSFEPCFSCESGNVLHEPWQLENYLFHGLEIGFKSNLCKVVFIFIFKCDVQSVWYRCFGLLKLPAFYIWTVLNSSQIQGQNAVIYFAFNIYVLWLLTISIFIQVEGTKRGRGRSKIILLVVEIDIVVTDGDREYNFG